MSEEAITFIDIISPEAAEGRLKTLYDRIKGPDGAVDNIMKAHSLRPASLEGHMALYKNILHHSANTTPKWLLEAIGVYVSLINNCRYCVDHHLEGLKRLLGDDEKAASMKAALAPAAERGRVDASVFGARETAALDYVRLLTLCPEAIGADDIERLRGAGWDDGEILEINQVASYFAYANRTALGLGVTVEGDILGLSPSAGENDSWSHR